MIKYRILHSLFTGNLWQTEFYLHKGVNSHDSHVRLTLGIVHQIEVDQLFQFQIVSLHAVHNIWEQSTEKKEAKCQMTSYST